MNNTEIEVKFSIYHDFLNHEEITEIIGFQPTSLWNKGDQIRRDLFRKESAWLYSTGNTRSLYLDNVLEPLIQKLEIKGGALSEYIKENKLNCKFDVILRIANNQPPSHYLSKRFIYLCNQLNADIDTDIYIF